MKRFFVTTAIDYTNASPHIGHAYEKIFADVIARYKRLALDDPSAPRARSNVYFLTGVDQHGTKVKQAAEQAGLDPKAFADRVTKSFLALWKRLGIDFDGWAATTDERHKRCVQKILKKLHDNGDLYKGKYSGYFSVRQEQFLTDKDRGPDGNFGPEWGEVVFIEEENWYFRLSKYRDWLVQFIADHPEFVCPRNRLAELTGALPRGTDLCISRPKSRLSWGIELLPFDPDYVTYVWFDALINYVSFAGYLAEEAEGLPSFRELWPAVHVIGKDILVPAHGVYWPCMLKAMGFDDADMPNLVVHGWWLKGEKISKSVGNIVDPNDLADRFGVPALRYYLMRDMALGRDAEFSEERLISRYNVDLANGLGNLLNRTLNMAQKYRSGRLYPVSGEDGDIRRVRELNAQSETQYCTAMERYETQAALERFSEIVTRANALVDATAPWKLAKDVSAAARLGNVLSALAESIHLAASLLLPFVPDKAGEVLAQLNSQPVRPGSYGESLSEGTFQAIGYQVAIPSPVFPRLEPAEK